MKISQAQIVPLQALNLLCQLLLRIVLFCEAEVSNFEGHPIFIDEDIGWFDVSMDQVFLVDVL